MAEGAFLTQAFFWMFAGLLLSAGDRGARPVRAGLMGFVGKNFLILILAQLGLVIVIQALITRINATVALGMFFVYAASLGLTIGLIASIYTTPRLRPPSCRPAMFGGAAIYGYTTKRSLAGIGGLPDDGRVRARSSR